jgi:hypothetical protein
VEYFVDTNFFLHCKKYDDLNWSEVTSDSKIIILISRTVQQEIDKLKNDGGNSRRAEKARKINRMFSEILNSNTLSMEKRTSDRHIILRFAENYSRKQLEEYSDGLDLSQNDDVILSMIKKYTTENGKNPCAFLSNDTGALTSAKYCNIPFIRIPDTWLLPVENDQRDKEIITLKKEIQSLKNKEPVIEMEFIFREIKIDKSPYDFDYPIYRLPDESALEEISRLYFAKHPIVKLQSIIEENKNSLFGLLYDYEPPSAREYSEYENKYFNWQKSFIKYLSEYIERKNTNQNVVPFILYISNSGNAPLKDMIVEFEVLTGGSLFNIPDKIPDKDQEAYPDDFTPPRIPDPPQGRTIEKTLAAIDSFNRRLKAAIPNYAPLMNSIDIPPPIIRTKHEHDPYAFYYQNRPEGKSTYWSFTCGLFPHQGDAESFEYYFFLNLVDDNKFTFRVKVSGSNLSKPVSNVYTLSINKKYIPYEDDILIQLDLAK